jgi:formylglycine-generating enzyme required for sulfatase activity
LRLPTSDEWEYACRAGTESLFHFGDAISGDVANYNGRITGKVGVKSRSRSATIPVASFPPNAWGLHDMHGNVAEWTMPDTSDDLPEPDGAPADEAEPRTWIRGGSYDDRPEECAAPYRSLEVLDARASDLGFRLAMDLIDVEQLPDSAHKQ